MDNMKDYIENYLEHCQFQKCLDGKLLKAYRIDLRQFSEKIPNFTITEIASKTLEQYIANCMSYINPKL